MTPAELRRKAAELRDKIKQLVLAAETENREMTGDELAVVEDLRAQAESLDRRAKMQDELLSTPAAPEPRASQPIETAAIEGVEGEGDKRRCFGEFLGDVERVMSRTTPAREAEEARDRIHNLYKSRYRDYSGLKNAEGRALTATTGASGGFLIPKDFQAEILRYGAPAAIVRPRARVIPMDGLEIEIPQLDASAVSGGSAHFGGVLMRWTGESETKPETEPTFKQLKLTAHELSGYCEVSRTVLRKSPISLDSVLFQLFGESAAREEDRAFFRGASAARPAGIHFGPSLVTTAARGNASNITYANATSVWTRIPETNRQNATWVYSQSAESAVLQMAGVSNGVFIQNTLVQSANGTSFNAGPAGVTLFNRPALMSSLLPALNSAGDFGCYDFTQYLVGDPGLMEVATSEHFKFQTNRVAFRLIHYVAGAPWPASALTLDDGSTTVSPFVVLGVQ